MAPADNLSPPGSSTYSSNTMYVGDGTWDATRNDFLLPNLMGFNFETMRYNGMGNRFKDFPGYYTLILGHAILAVMVFLFAVPAAILIARYHSRNPRMALRIHIYLQILTVLLSTVLFVLGFMAVGERRSLTNPHHGIGVAIYVLVLVQFLGGAWIHRRERKRGAPRKLPVKLVLHQWLGRAIALLGFAQVPLGLTLYGSPKFTFILYAVWMFFLLVLFFVLSYRAMPIIGEGLGRSTSYGGSVIEERKSSRFGGLFGPLAAGAGAAALLGRRRASRSRSRSRRDDVIPSRRGSGSYIDEEKFEESRKKKGGGFTDKLLKGAALVGAAGLAKSWYDRRQQRREDDEYSSVAHDTPSRRHGSRRHGDSEISEDSIAVQRVEQGRPTGPILPGPGDPVAAAAAISASEPRPITPRPVRRRDSYDSDDYSYYDSTLSPSRRTQQSHGARNGLLAGLGLGWFAKKMKDRRDRKELERLDRLEAERVEQERLARTGNTPSRLTGDGAPPSRRRGRMDSVTQSSDISSLIDDPHTVRPGGIPPVPSALASTVVTGAGAGINQSRSRHDITDTVVSMPPAPPDPHGVLHEESGSEAYNSAGGHPHRRHSERRRREGEAAAAIAAAGAASLAAEEEARRQRSRSRVGDPAAASGGVASPPVSVKMQIHNDKDRRVTLRRLTEQEAAAEREAKRSERRRRRDSLSSLSGTDTATSRRRYRRDAASGVGGGSAAPSVAVTPAPPPMMEPLSPPNPAFAGGRRPKDSAYYSGRPGEPGPSGLAGGSGIGSEKSHGTWSAMSQSVSGADTVDPAERRRRRRLERNKSGAGPGTVDFT